MPRVLQYSEDRIQTQIRLPRELHERLRYQATERMVSMNLLMEKAIEASLVDWEKAIKPPAPATRKRRALKTA